MRALFGGKPPRSSRGFRAAIKIALFLLALCVCVMDHRAIAGQRAPEFALLDLSGRKVTLSEHRGRVVILDFWATWCMPCRMSIPELVELQDKYGGKGLSVLGVNMDLETKTRYDNLVSYKRKYKISYPILHSDERVVADYFHGAQPKLPTAFVIDREGNIREVVEGYRFGALEKAVKRLLE